MTDLSTLVFLVLTHWCFSSPHKCSSFLFSYHQELSISSCFFLLFTKVKLMNFNQNRHDMEHLQPWRLNFMTKDCCDSTAFELMHLMYQIFVYRTCRTLNYTKIATMFYFFLLQMSLLGLNILFLVHYDVAVVHIMWLAIDIFNHQQCFLSAAYWQTRWARNKNDSICAGCHHHTLWLSIFCRYVIS